MKKIYSLVIIFFVFLLTFIIIYINFKPNFEHNLILKKNLENHYPVFSPIDQERKKNNFKHSNSKEIFHYSQIANSISIANCSDNSIILIQNDKFGFRNQSELWNNSNIVAFGDSLSFATCLKFNFIDLYNKNHLGKILNLSQPGNQITTDSYLLSELINYKKIKFAIFFIYDESLNYLTYLEKNNHLKKYESSNNYSQNYFLNKNKYDHILEKDLLDQLNQNKVFLKKNIIETHILYPIKNFLIYAKLKFKFYKNKQEVAKNLKSSEEKNIEIFKKKIISIKNLSQKNNFNFVIVFIKPKKNNNIVLEKNIGFLKKEKIDFDVIELYHFNKYISDDKSHLTKYGHEYAALRIDQILSKFNERK